MDCIAAQRLPVFCRRNYFYEFLHMLPWGLVAGIVEGNFAAVVVQETFRGSALQVWIASTAPVGVYITSMVWGALCVGRRKIALMTVAAAGVTLALAAVVLTPTSPFGTWCFVAQMAASQFFMTGVITVRTALWRANYPVSIRGRATARFQMVRALTGIVAVMASAALFDKWPNSYRLVFPFIALCGVAGTLLIRRVRVRGEAAELSRLRGSVAPGSARRISAWDAANPIVLCRQAVRVFRDDPRFTRYMVSLMSTGVGNLLVRTVVIFVVASELPARMGGNPRTFLIATALLDGIPRLVMLLALHGLGHWFDRVGVLPFRVVNGLCWFGSIATGTVGTLFVLYADRVGGAAVTLALVVFTLRAILLGLAYAGGALAYNLGHLHFARPDQAEIYMGIHVTLSGLRGLIMPGLGVLLWHWIGWPVWLIACVFSFLGFLGYSDLARTEPPAGDHSATRSPRT